MSLSTTLAVFAARASRRLLRMAHRGGTNVPGTIALKIKKSILRDLSRGVKVILVTGTNGKTTITRMIEQELITAGKSYFTNKSGANMDTGIAAEFLVNSTILGKCKYDYALIECDELAFKYVSRYCNIECVVVSNIFRDQLDRYGEITHTVTGIFEGIKNIPDATVCLNADCSLSRSLADRIPNKILYYGINCPIYENRVKEVSDAPYCIKCGAEYNYDYITYGHLGKYRCPECGYSRPDPQVFTEKIITSDADSTTVLMNIFGKAYDVRINLPGGYNIYNAVAAATVGKVMEFSDDEIITALKGFSCGFGRMEKFHIENTDIRMILVKNPAGANQVLNFLVNIKTPSVFAVGLNDRYADGTDISWIWDADFEMLNIMGENLKKIIVTGIRADELALRFKYAGIDTDKIEVEKDYEKLLKNIVASGVDTFIMPTYTCMLSLRELFTKIYNIEEYWK